MKLQLQGTRLISALGMMSPFGMVLVAWVLPIVVAAVAQGVGIGAIATIILIGVVMFLATIGVGLRFGTWRALYLALIPGGLFTATYLLLRSGRVSGIVEDPVAWGMAIVTLLWLVGIAVGVLMRKAVFRRSQLFP